MLIVKILLHVQKFYTYIITITQELIEDGLDFYELKMNLPGEININIENNLFSGKSKSIFNGKDNRQKWTYEYAH